MTMKLVRMLVAALVAFATPVAAQGASAAAAAPPPVARTEADLAVRFRSALTYEAFTASDTSSDAAKRALWTANDGRADASVAEVVARVRALPGRWHLLIVAESWCPDAANSVPYLARLAAEADNVDLRVLRKADAADLIAAHPLDGRDATPLVLVLDERFAVRGVWIERPASLNAIVAKKAGRICESTLKTQVASWYRQDAGRAVLGEVVALLERAGATSVAARP